MINRITESALKTPGLVLLAVLAVLGIGVVQYKRMPVDAFPDISPIMVPVFAEGHGMAPEEIERLITYPIESSMNGLPGVTQIKSTSAFGMAVIYVYFKDSTDIYFARQLVGERLASVMAELPETDEPPTLGPISTGLGQIFLYYLEADPDVVDTGGKPLDTWLRELNDWVVKFQLQTVPGVTEILSIGGHVLQYQIRVNPNALRKYDLTLENLVESVRENNRNVGGQFLVLGSEEHLLRGIGLVESLDDIQNIAVKEDDGRPVLLSDVAEVAYGNEIRRGVVTLNGEREVVSGMVLKLFGENTSQVIERLYGKVAEVKKALPEGVTLIPYYEQAELVRNATRTVKKSLLIGSILVVVTLGLFLGNLRTAFIVALSLPICALVAVLCMGVRGISANLMSLGGIAIAIGMLGDGAIVMVENLFRHLGEPHARGESKAMVIYDAAKEVNRPIVFSIAIIIIVFLPLFTLEGVEGKMFAPMAFTISFALLGSLLVAVLVAPVLSLFLLKQAPHKELALVRVLKAAYRPLLAGAVRFKYAVMGVAVAALVGSLALVPKLGTEFIPTLEEGSILIGVTMSPSISLEEGTKLIMEMEKEVVQFDAVDETISRVGRPEAGSHPHPVNYAEVHIELKPMDEWGELDSKEELIEAIGARLKPFPGVQLNFTQPIQNAFDELLSGIRAQLAIKIYGEDLSVLRQKAEEVRGAIDNIPGLVDLSSEQSFGQPQVQIVADRAACARYGVTVSEIMEMVELAVGGEVIDSIYLHTRRFGIHMRFQEEYRSDPEAVRNILVPTISGFSVPLSQVANVRQVTGPIQINRERNQRRWIVQGNVRGRDLGGVVADIQTRIAEKVELPPGYTIEYGGQFENQQRAMKRLTIIVPTVIGLVLVMLWMSFGVMRHALIIIVNVPLALIGGILGLLITGSYLSVPASVGFIALFGIAVQNGMVLVTYFNDLRERGKSVAEAVTEGAELRLRPVLMTAMTTVLGLLPLLLATGIGADVQRPLATVVVFGLTTSTLLTLFVIPAVYVWVEERMERKQVD
ncbi:MAG: CusA/CzcA family heavy metal efflux RND transporter [Verrucomicrobia bacterium]|nr:CusA/CzcA family heavy metal efflux RND transporter [Verrucomicrobiota bacterium]MDA1085709.1 CusA/CzcA family heavy metal efflux RND transporter [Verrucomicrobiota bacterium]